MYFDRETTVVVTKLNHLSEIAINNYCQKFGTVIRCLIKTSSHSRNKDPYALVKFAEPASVNTLLTNPNHNIEGVHVLMRPFHHETKTAAPSASNNASTSSSSTNQPRPSHFDQIMQENLALKYEIATLQKSLTEAQNYSKTAYETFQALREKYEAEQILTNQLKSDHAAMIESYENRLKQLPTQTTTTTTTNANEKDKVKDEPMDSDTQQTNHQLEMQIIKDRLEQAQIDLGKCQTENAILQAKLASREQQFEARFKELSCQHARLKKQYEHVTSCIKEFHTKLYPRKRLKLEKRENQQNENSHDGSDDVVEIVMQVDSAPSQN